MSLDVYLSLDNSKVSDSSHIFIRENGQTKAINRKEWDERFPGIKPIVFTSTTESRDVFQLNITHNLGKMAKEANIYAAIWRPEEINILFAKDLIPLLEKGLLTLLSKPSYFKQFNPENGWGDYDVLVSFVVTYLQACHEYSEAKVSVWR